MSRRFSMGVVLVLALLWLAVIAIGTRVEAALGLDD